MLPVAILGGITRRKCFLGCMGHRRIFSYFPDVIFVLVSYRFLFQI